MKKIETDELKQIQLDILKNVHDFCHENGISYSLAFGTLLGAVWHKGYIPWDDDVDIMMLRPDYEKFVRSFGNAVYQVADACCMKGYHLPFAKVYDVRTQMRERVAVNTDYGVYIDVFPVDNIPDAADECAALLRKKQKWNAVHTLKILRVRRGRSLAKNLAVIAARPLLAPLSISHIVRKLQACCTPYNNIRTQRVGIIAPTDNSAKEMWPRSLFAEYISLPFEHINVMAVKDYDQILTACYGNYLQLPPEAERITHHAYEAWWK